jgi:peptide/nickel transport system substrate-binding protein
LRLPGLALGVGLLAGCAAVPPAPTRDVRVVLYAEPSSMSLIGHTDANSAQLASVISDGLIAYDGKGAYVPMVARAWEMSPDGLTLTFHLRDGVVWHDGQPVTSRDVAFTWQKVRDPSTDATSWISQFSDVSSVETPNERTVVVRYVRPYADALDAWRVPLVPEHVVTRDTDFLGGSFAKHPVGCGPYRFASRKAGQDIVLEAFDRYWQGRPSVDRIVAKIVGSERTAFEALLLGDVDLMSVTPDLWREAKDSPRASRLARLLYFRLALWKVDWNQDGTNPYFADPRVRHALVEALDRGRFAESVALGLARPLSTTYPPESPWHDPRSAPIPYDPVDAARLLDAAGWKLPPGKKVRVKDGVPLRFTMLLPAGGQEIADRIAAWMQDSLAQAGVEMSIEKLEWRAFQERRKSHAFQAAMASIVVDPIADQFDLYHSSAGFNYGGFKDAEVDRLIEEGRVTVDPTARRAIYDRLQQRLAALEPLSVLFQFAQPILHDPRLQGVTPSPVGLFSFQPGPRAWRWAN